jgi:hypothetical protein
LTKFHKMCIFGHESTGCGKWDGYSYLAVSAVSFPADRLKYNFPELGLEYILRRRS